MLPETARQSIGGNHRIRRRGAGLPHVMRLTHARTSFADPARRRFAGSPSVGAIQEALTSPVVDLLGHVLAHDTQGSVKLTRRGHEPYEGLAPVIVKEIEKIVADIKSEGITTIIVEQNALAALELAGYPSVILDMGQVAFDGKASEVLENSELRSNYLAL